MDPTAFFTASKVHIVAGKGGVGKTTVTAALGRAAATAGLDVLLIEIEGRGSLPALFGRRQLGYREEVLAPRIRARSLQADQALIEYLAEHGFGPLARRMIDTGLVEVIARGAPGMKDILLLGKIKQLERAGAADVILVDAPASGHAISFLRSPRGLLDAVAGGPINSQAREVLDLLTDPARCQVLLVTTPEETPVNELIETAFSLEDEVGLHLGPLVVNGVLPVLDLPEPHEAGEAGETGDPAARNRPPGGALPEEVRALVDDELRRAAAAAVAHRRRRQLAQRQQLDRLAEELPLPRIELQQRPVAGLDPSHVGDLGDELLAAIRAS